MHWYPFHWYPYLCIGMDAVMEWIGIQCIGIHCYAMDTNPRPGSGQGKGTKRARGGLITIPATNQISGGENHVQLRCLRRRTGAARPYAPHRLREEPVPHRRPGLLPTSHRQGRGGRRRHHRGEGRRGAGGVRISGVNIPGSEHCGACLTPSPMDRCTPSPGTNPRLH